jgi:hypothetical protein
LKFSGKKESLALHLVEMNTDPDPQDWLFAKFVSFIFKKRRVHIFYVVRMLFIIEISGHKVIASRDT